MSETADRIDAGALRTWLTERVADLLRMPPEDIESHRPLPDYGLDSIYALSIVVEIEDHLGLQLEATMVWDHPSIDSLVEVLATKTAEAS
ncbi:acyl carrier protein [Streptomyces europaeiscabiei]|uniref:acyl carrier protein n=1 Tax=Streptomyces europaeiscabiei TaxID=146819 RepID=UPI002E1732A4